MDVYCTLLSDVVAERKRKISFCPEFVIQLAITLIMNSKEEWIRMKGVGGNILHPDEGCKLSEKKNAHWSPLLCGEVWWNESVDS